MISSPILKRLQMYWVKFLVEILMKPASLGTILRLTLSDE